MNTALATHLSDINEGLFNLQGALDAHEALAMLLSHCSQNLDGSDATIPVAPEKLASLLAAANLHARQHIHALKQSHRSASNCALA